MTLSLILRPEPRPDLIGDDRVRERITEIVQYCLAGQHDVAEALTDQMAAELGTGADDARDEVARLTYELEIRPTLAAFEDVEGERDEALRVNEELRQTIAKMRNKLAAADAEIERLQEMIEDLRNRMATTE